MKLQAERQKFVLKIIGVIIMMALTFLAGYITNKDQLIDHKNTGQH